MLAEHDSYRNRGQETSVESGEQLGFHRDCSVKQAISEPVQKFTRQIPKNSRVRAGRVACGMKTAHRQAVSKGYCATSCLNSLRFSQLSRLQWSSESVYT